MYMPGDTIVRVNTKADRMFFIQEGNKLGIGVAPFCSVGSTCIAQFTLWSSSAAGQLCICSSSVAGRVELLDDLGLTLTRLSEGSYFGGEL